MSLLFVLALAPHVRLNRHSTGNPPFVKRKVNGNDVWCHKDHVYSLPEELKAWNEDCARVAKSAFVIQQGGAFALLLQESTAPVPVETAPVSFDTMVAPANFSDALVLLPLILAPEEQEGMLIHARDRVASIKAKLAAAQAPVVADLPAIALTPEPIAGELPVEQEKFHVEQPEDVEQGDDDDVTAAIDSPAVEMVGQLPTVAAPAGDDDEAESEKPKKASKKAAKAK